MAKVKSTLFDKIQGKLGNVYFRVRRNGTIEMGEKIIPFNPRTDAQLAQRTKYKDCYQQWNSLTEEEKQNYEEKAKPLGISGYNLFMQECLTATTEEETTTGIQLRITEDWES